MQQFGKHREMQRENIDRKKQVGKTEKKMNKEW